MAYVQTYRSGWSRFLAVTAVGIAVAFFVSIIMAREVEDALRWTPALLLLAVGGWLAYGRPEVRVDDHGVTLQDITRRVVVPWPALVEIDSRYGLRLETADGNRWSAWAVPAPVGMQRARGEQTEAALLVRQRWEQLRGRGDLDGRRADEPVVVHPDLAALGVLGVLAVATPLSLLLLR